MKVFSRVDKPVFAIAAIVSLIFVGWAVLSPENAGKTIDSWMAFFTDNFGWLYLLLYNVVLVFLIFLTIGKTGNIKLGKDTDVPEYKTSHWFFMLFSASMGIGLVFWSVAEPVFHFANPPFEAMNSTEAAEIAMRTTFMHYGLHPWAIHGIIGLSLAYWQFRKGKPALISSALIPIYGEKGAAGLPGKTIDSLAVFATIFGVATSLGLGALQINSGLNYVYGIENSTRISIIIVIVVTVCFIISAVSGIQKGILYLSNINMFISGLLLLFVLLAGPTIYILDTFVDTLGVYLNDMIRLGFWTDPNDTRPGWLSSWTVFYWGWWLAWTPFVSGFIARISKGRTLREYIFGTLFAPVAVSLFWMAVMGGAAIWFGMQGDTSIIDAVNANVANSLFALLMSLPMPEITCAVSLVLIFTFFITSADSATFVCAMITTHGDPNPQNGIKVFWGILEGAVAAVLLLVGGLAALQTASIVASFPFIFILLIIMIAMYKTFFLYEVKGIKQKHIPDDPIEKDTTK